MADTSRDTFIFQYFAIAPTRGLGLKDGLIAAAKADFISLTAFEVGLFSWIAIMTFVPFPAPHHLMPSSAAYKIPGTRRCHHQPPIPLLRSTPGLPARAIGVGPCRNTPCTLR